MLQKETNSLICQHISFVKSQLTSMTKFVASLALRLPQNHEGIMNVKPSQKTKLKLGFQSYILKQ
jgi:hypothetical protein